MTDHFDTGRVGPLLLGGANQSIDLLMSLAQIPYHLSGFCALLCSGCIGCGLQITRWRVDSEPELSEEFIRSSLACSHLSEESLWYLVCIISISSNLERKCIQTNVLGFGCQASQQRSGSWHSAQLLQLYALS